MKIVLENCSMWNRHSRSYFQFHNRIKNVSIPFLANRFECDVKKKEKERKNKLRHMRKDGLESMDEWIKWNVFDSMEKAIGKLPALRLSQSSDFDICFSYNMMKETKKEEKGLYVFCVLLILFEMRYGFHVCILNNYSDKGWTVNGKWWCVENWKWAHNKPNITCYLLHNRIA